MRHVHKNLSLGVEQIERDVSLKFSLNVSCNAIKRRRFKGSNNRTVPCAYVSPATNGLLEKLVNFTEKARNI